MVKGEGDLDSDIRRRYDFINKRLSYSVTMPGMSMADRNKIDI